MYKNRESNEILICNPPINFLTNMHTHIGHLFYSTILDVSARFREAFENKKVDFPTRSYNLFGKPTEKYLLENNINLFEFKEFFLSHIEKDFLIRNLNLINEEVVIDDDEKVKNALQKSFKILNEKNYLIIKDNEIFLDLSKLDKNKLIDKLEKIKITPEKVRNDIKYLIINNCNKPLKISRERSFSIDSKITKEKIAPFYIVTNFWDGYFSHNNYVLACSFNLILRSAVLRMVTKYMENNEIGLSEIIVYPKLLGEDVKKWDIKKISDLYYAKDLLRLAMMYSYTQKRNKLNATNDSQKFAIKIVRRLLSMRKKVMRISLANDRNISHSYIHYMQNFKYLNAIQELWIETTELDKNKQFSQKEFDKLLDKYYPFIPILTKNIKAHQNIKAIEEEISKYKSLILGE